MEVDARSTASGTIMVAFDDMRWAERAFSVNVLRPHSNSGGLCSSGLATLEEKDINVRDVVADIVEVSTPRSG